MRSGYLPVQSLHRTPFLTKEARQSKRRHRNNRRVPPIARCTAHRKHVRGCCIKNTRKRHGSLTTIIGRGQRCEVLNASRALPWRKGHAAATHLGLCNRIVYTVFATSSQLAFLHLPTLNTVLTPIGNSPAALINSQEYQITLLRSVPVIKRPQSHPYHTPAWVAPSPPPVISFTLRVINQ
jgi:hypothetical protein